MKSYGEMSKDLSAILTDHSMAEIHGMLTGLRCSGSRANAGEMVGQIAEVLEVSLTREHSVALTSLLESIESGLQDPELSFTLYLPGEDETVTNRTYSLSQWCTGFLAGFGISGRYQQSELNEEMKELLTDLSRIATLEEEIPDDDENETDLIEISEYVRMAALMIFTECSGGSVH